MKGGVTLVHYRTLLFDADETLLDFPRSERAALCEALQRSGITPNSEMIEEYSRINSATWKRLERGEITKEALRIERFFEFCRYFGLQADVPRMAADYLASLATQSFLLEDALEVCRILTKCCDLYIITNGIADVQHGRLDRSPIRPFFKDIFISEELGAEKPNPAFFEAVASRIPNFEIADTLVVGDSLTSDMAGGIMAGLDTCWLNFKGKEKPSHLPITYVIGNLRDVIPLVLGA